MPSEIQTDFSGGLNTRLPAHKIGPNQTTELTNVDLSHGDLRGEYGVSGDGQKDFFYEAGDAWVSSTGFIGGTDILDWPSSFLGTEITTTASSGTATKLKFTSSSHGLGNGDIVQFTSTGTMPGEVNTSTNYYVNDKTDDDFYIELSVDGGNIAYTSSGSGVKWNLRHYTTTVDVNYFGTDAQIGDNVTFQIKDDGTVTFYDKSYGFHGANSYVEYNDDLFVGRSNFTVSAIPDEDETILETGDHTYKLQVGDELSQTTTITEGTYITKVSTSTVTLSLPAKAGDASTPYDISVKPIISKFLDGDTTTSYRVGVSKPTPIIEYGQSATGGTRDGSHSTDWYGASDPIPFQYAVSQYDQSGIESTISESTSSGLGAIGNSAWLPAGNDVPQKIVIDNIADLKSSSPEDSISTMKNGRFALYRVGGSSAIYKRLDNLFLDTGLGATTSMNTNGGSPSNGYVDINLTGAKNICSYKLKWFAYSSDGYRFDNADTGYTYPAGTGVYSTTGETDYILPTSNNITFTLLASGGGSTTTHYLDFLVYMKIPGELVEREYVCRAMNNNNLNAAANSSAPLSGTVVDYIDFRKADALVDIQPISENTTPRPGIEGLIESSNLFYGYSGNRLFISNYGNPNSWPESGYLDFDQDVTGLGKLGSELVVFTEYGMYRVFGSDPTLLKKVQIPTTDGVKAGAGNTIISFQDGLLFAGLNGICFYNGQSVSRVTQGILDTFSLPHSTASNNHGGYLEDTYYLLGSTGTGYKLDMKRGAMLSRTEMNANNLYFKGSDNTLYGDTGKVGATTGTLQNFTVTTRKFDGGDINEEKVYYSVKLTGVDFTGTVNVLVDGAQTDTFSLSSVTDLDRTLYLGSPRQGNGIQVQLSSCTGQINRIVVNYDSYVGMTDNLFDSVTMKYIGTPTVAVDIDGTNKITATALSAPTGAIGEGKLYFPAMSNGVVPHLRETNNESSGRILSFQYSATPV